MRGLKRFSLYSERREHTKENYSEHQTREQHRSVRESSTTTITEVSRPTEINLQLSFPIKMERKLFKSPPIARLKSAPKKRTEKNIKVSSRNRPNQEILPLIG